LAQENGKESLNQKNLNTCLVKIALSGLREKGLKNASFIKSVATLNMRSYEKSATNAA